MEMQALAAQVAEVSHAAATRVLIVGGPDDDCGLSDRMEERGYDVRRAAIEALPGGWADAIVLMANDLDEDDVLRFCAANRGYDGPPLLILQAGADADFAIAALEAGADDCLPPPHNPREVAARVRALTRRRAMRRNRCAAKIKVEGVSFDLNRRRAESASGRVDLTEHQARLLTVLMARPGEVVNRQVLLDAILGPNGEAFDRAVDVQICRLKKRLARISSAELIGAYRGVGYRINVQCPA
jgi:DNA-binding response OmpR family regulator